jgi:methyl-accepting chemotaxis protein WspA
MKLRIGPKIFLGYFVALLVLLGISAGAYLAASRITQAFDEAEQFRNLIDQIDNLDLSLHESINDQRTFLLTGNEALLAGLRRTASGLDAAVAEIAANPAAAEHKEEVAQIGSLSRKLLEGLDKEVALKENQAELTASVNLLTGVESDLHTVMNNLKESSLLAFGVLHQRAKSSARLLELAIAIGSPLCILLVIAVGIGVTRNITRPLTRLTEKAGQMASGDLALTLDEVTRSDEIGDLARSFSRTIEALCELIADVQRSGIQVNSTVVELSANSKEQQSTAAEVASTTTEISATAKEMSATSTELLKTADGVSAVAEQASRLATEGQRGLERMHAIMRGILEASSNITTRLGVMNEKAGNINAVVTTITKVADQTNLLSLNAAIEAEKAGEYGRGFAVVASEIRRLADQTAAATGDIEQMVKEMVGAVSSSVMGMDKFGEELRRGAEGISAVSAQLDKVIEEVQSLAPSVESVNEGMRAQTQGAQQISEALVQLGEATRLNAESVRDIGRSVEQLGETAYLLKTGVSKFKVST